MRHKHRLASNVMATPKIYMRQARIYLKARSSGNCWSNKIGTAIELTSITSRHTVKLLSDLLIEVVMSNEQFASARDLISQKRYPEARSILQDINNDTSRQWIEKLDKMAAESPGLSSAQPVQASGVHAQ